MKKVAHVCTTALSYKILVDKLTLLKKYNYDIYLVSSEKGFNEELMANYEFKYKFVEMDRKINPLRDLISILKLKKVFEEEGFDIVHTHTAKGGVIGRVAATLAGVPLVLHTAHGLPFYEGQSKVIYFIYKTLEKIGSFFCHSVGSQNKEDLRQLKSIVPKNVPVYYEGNGVDLEKLDETNKNISEKQLCRLKNILNIRDEQVVIFVGARFEPVKDHSLLIKSLKDLKEKYQKDFVCLLAGEGVLEKEINNEIVNSNLSNNVKIIGHQTDIYPYIKLADIVALTSMKEGIPRIIMESMAFSKPVVATDVLGTRELVINNETGILVPYQNIEGLSDAFNLLITNSHLRVDYGKQGRKRIEKEFTEEIVANRIHDFYSELQNSI